MGSFDRFWRLRESDIAPQTDHEASRATREVESADQNDGHSSPHLWASGLSAQRLMFPYHKNAPFSVLCRLTTPRAYVWLSPQLDELESLRFDQDGQNSRGTTGFINPCTLWFFSVAGHSGISGRLPTRGQAYHDMTTHNITDGTGGMDASIRFDAEQSRGENQGDGRTPSRFWSATSTATSLVAFRSGRVDAGELNTPGVPMPQEDLETHIEKFARQEFTQTEMIGLIACGHTFGGVQQATFPDIVPTLNKPNNLSVAHFDTTLAHFDHNIATEYIAGTTQDPLILWNMTQDPDRTMRLLWDDHLGGTHNVSLPFSGASSAATGRYSAVWYAFNATADSPLSLDAAAGITRMHFAVDDTLADQDGAGFAVQDGVVFSNSSCLANQDPWTGRFDIAPSTDSVNRPTTIEIDVPASAQVGAADAIYTIWNISNMTSFFDCTIGAKIDGGKFRRMEWQVQTGVAVWDHRDSKETEMESVCQVFGPPEDDHGESNARIAEILARAFKPDRISAVATQKGREKAIVCRSSSGGKVSPGSSEDMADATRWWVQK
ncbi:hypothetical protein C8R44DRAFT_924331 [Mycena epipterygia]|nr:hypothetical protein C8R44DRAFT_924331 [Mycena epipterygia]